MGLCQKERRIDCWFQLCFVILAHLEWFRVYDMLLCDLNPPLSRKGWIWWRPPQEWWGVAGFYWSFQHGSCVSPTGQMGHQIIFQGWEKYISQIISPLILVEYHLDLCSGKKTHLQRWIFSLTTPFFHGFPSTPRTTDGFHRPRGDHHEQRGFPCAGRGERGISPMLNGCPFGTCSPNTYTYVRCFHSNLMSFCWWEVFVVGSFWSI